MAIRTSGLISGLDTESLIKEITSKYTVKKDKIWKQQQSLVYKQDAWKELNKDVYSFFQKTSDMRLTSSYKKDKIKVSDSAVASVSGKVNGQQNLKVNQVATKSYLTSGKIENDAAVGVTGALKLKKDGAEQEINITADMSMKDIAQKFADAGLISNYDEDNKRLFLASQETGALSNFEVCGDAGLLDALGLGTAAAFQSGRDASITLNGADFASSDNKFVINNMTIIAQTAGIVTVDNQVDSSLFDSIKDFIEKYNELIKKIDTSYNSTTAKGYEPLTDEEKYALSDKQIEDWENKLKEGALSKDSTLSELGSMLKITMGTTVIDGMTLNSLGISLGDYFATEKNERNVYNIDEDKLREAIEKDSSKVINFMTKLSASIYDQLNKKMRSSSLNSVYTIYHDKEMKKTLQDYDNKLKEMEAKIAAVEDKYYAQFAKMETLLSKTQSKSTYLSNFFGI